MAGDTAREAAEAILADLRRAGYYKDPDILADFLQRTFGILAPGETAVAAAGAILADLDGARYYEDVNILADFLDGTFAPPLSSDLGGEAAQG